MWRPRGIRIPTGPSLLAGRARTGARSILARFLVYFGLSALLVLALLLAYEYQRFNLQLERRTVQESQRLASVTYLLSREIQEGVGGVRVLARHSEMRAFIAGEPGAREELEQEFAAFAEYTGVYDQVRLLDTHGKELVRVNFREGDAIVTPPSLLQDKSDRYYYRDLLHTEPGQVYISPLDLNEEFGRIEQPLKPVIRFGTAVFDARDRVAGYVVLNALANRFISEFQEAMGGSWGTPMLVNRDGYWLKGPAPEVEWGFQLGHGRSLRETYPDIWEYMARRDQGRIRSPEGIFVFRTLRPRLLSGDEALIGGQSPAWRVISHMPRETVTLTPAMALQGQAGRIVPLIALIAALTFPLAWYRTSSLRRNRDLVESRRRLAEAQQIARVGSWLVDVRDGRTEWSDETYRILGLAPGSVQPNQEHFMERVHPEERDLFRENFAKALQGPSLYAMEHRIVRPSGEIRFVQEYGIVERDAGGRPVRFHGTIQDMTDHERAEEQVRESEARFRLLAETIEDVFWLTTPAFDRTIYVSPAYATIWGMDADRLREVPLAFLEAVHPDDRRGLEERLLGGDPSRWDNEFRIILKDGDVRWIHDRRFPVWAPGGGIRYIAGVAVDVTAKKRAVEAMEETAAVFDSTSEAIAVTDGTGRVLSVNPAFTGILGYTPEEAAGRPLSGFASDEHAEQHEYAIRAIVEETGRWRGEAGYRRKDGEGFPAIESISAIQSRGEARYVHVVTDVSALKMAEEKLAYLAHHDALTGLPNRLMFTATLEKAAERARRNDRKLALLFLDLDRFKRINDTLGHHAGDRLLQVVAGRLLDSVRAEDTVARLGGDEFTVIMEEVRRGEDAALLAEKLLEAVACPAEIAGREVVPSVSIGISLFPDDADNCADFTRVADSAMYRAKENGRNRCEFYTPELTAAAMRHLNMEHGLRRALAQGEFELHYQPQVASFDGHLVGAEALLRWRHPEFGLLTPSAFIEVAEETGLIKPIGQWVLQTAIAQAAAWRNDDRSLRISVNVSGHQILRNNFGREVEKLLLEAAPGGIPRHGIELEITESVLQDSGEATEVLHYLRGLGFSIAIDDFGTGYSSLSQLKHLPVDTLKIASEFVKNIPTTSDDEAIAATIVAMGHTLGLEVVAEGVETVAQLLFMQRQRCDFIQGFLFSEAVPAEALTELIRGGMPLPLRQQQAVWDG